MPDPKPPSEPFSLTRAAAFAVSAVTSPFVVTAVTVTLVVLLLRPTLPQLLLWTGIAVLFGAVLPFCFVFYMWRMGRVTDCHVGVREQRAWPFVVAIASGAIGVGLLYATGAPPPLVALGAVYLVVGLSLAVVSLQWKISVHSGVLTAAIISLTVVGYHQALYALALVPLVMWARRYRGKHTLAQGLVPLVMVAILTPSAYYGTLMLMR
ncbi:MAG: hypothetical protein ABFD94_15545 [Armatimonadia bacterium]